MATQTVGRFFDDLDFPFLDGNQRYTGEATTSGSMHTRLARAISRHKMKKHFVTEIGDEAFTWRRDDVRIAAEAALDGFYIVSTNVPRHRRLDAAQTVGTYKSLAHVERTFRTPQVH